MGDVVKQVLTRHTALNRSVNQTAGQGGSGSSLINASRGKGQRLGHREWRPQAKDHLEHIRGRYTAWPDRRARDLFKHRGVHA